MRNDHILNIKNLGFNKALADSWVIASQIDQNRRENLAQAAFQGISRASSLGVLDQSRGGGSGLVGMGITYSSYLGNLI